MRPDWLKLAKSGGLENLTLQLFLLLQARHNKKEMKVKPTASFKSVYNIY